MLSYQLELTRECQTTIDERMVAEGIAVRYYACPLCDDGHRHQIIHPEYGRVYVFDCCFLFCHNEVVEGQGCSNCDHCESCCSCYACDYCGERVDDVCSNCEQCDSCCSCYTCESCECRTQQTTTVGGSEYCDSCLDNYCSYCDDCEEYYPDDDCHEHQHEDCDCEAPVRRFRFPANGAGTIAQNELLTVELPKGTIDAEGLRLIAEVLRSEIGTPWIIPGVLDEIGPLWQAKRGNFTRRLSAALYKEEQIKLEAGVLSKIGNIARQHSSDTATWIVEFTRELNESAEYFYHDDSCWWASYGGNRPESAVTSRCCLKNWGGLGIRSFDSTDDDYASGRAWVQPLNEDLEPTHDALNAHAYVIYNPYGAIDGYVSARIIAHLTSRSYKRIAFGANHLYVNGNVGYLVADEAICADTESIRLNHGSHATLDAGQIRETTRRAA